MNVFKFLFLAVEKKPSRAETSRYTSQCRECGAGSTVTGRMSSDSLLSPGECKYIEISHNNSSTVNTD